MMCRILGEMHASSAFPGFVDVEIAVGWNWYMCYSKCFSTLITTDHWLLRQDSEGVCKQHLHDESEWCHLIWTG
jgi:hypothetical protein